MFADTVHIFHALRPGCTCVMSWLVRYIMQGPSTAPPHFHSHPWPIWSDVNLHACIWQHHAVTAASRLLDCLLQYSLRATSAGLTTRERSASWQPPFDPLRLVSHIAIAERLCCFSFFVCAHRLRACAMQAAGGPVQHALRPSGFGVSGFSGSLTEGCYDIRRGSVRRRRIGGA